jgi:phosphomevalonate kinase
MRNLIAISGKQFVGKDSFTDYLLENLEGFQKIPLAKAIKNEFAALYGLTPHEVEENKVLYRPSLIAIGQRRRQNDPDYWLKQVLAIPGGKIISDMRLRHEYDVLKRAGAFCIRIESDRDLRAQRGQLVKEDDATECELDKITDWDAIVVNNGSFDDLRKKAQDLAKVIQSQ